MRIKFYASFFVTVLFIFYFSNNIFSQDWFQAPNSLFFESKPNSSNFENLIGANTGKELNQNGMDFPASGIIKNVRSFHLMESDFGNNFFPKDIDLQPLDCDCSQIFSYSDNCRPEVCDNGSTGPGGNQIQYGFHNWKLHYCGWRNNANITHINASLEAIFPIFDSICVVYDSVRDTCLQQALKSTRGFPASCWDPTKTGIGLGYPNKWYTDDQWADNGDLNGIRQKAAKYAESFAATFCPDESTGRECVVEVLEVGNEPWGASNPTRNAYHAICWGVIDGLTSYYQSNNPDEWRMELSTAAFKAHTDANGCFDEPNQYIDVMIPNQIENGKSLRDYFKYVSIHNYAFPNPCQPALNLSEIPESPNSLFLTLKNMKEWMNANMQNAKLNLTEFGWNTHGSQEGCYHVGEVNQAAYLIRAFLLAARYDINKAYAYAFYDSPAESLYCSVGLQSTTTKKKSLMAIEKLMNNIEHKHFIKAISEDENQNGKFAYLIGDYDENTGVGTPTHLVAWRAVDLGQLDNGYPTPDVNAESFDLGDLEVNTNSNYFYLGWDNSQDGSINNGTVNASGNSVSIKLSGLPVVIPLNPTSCTYDANGVLSSSCADGSNGSGNGDCSGLTFSGGSGQITVGGFTAGAAGLIEYIGANTGWSNVLHCTGNCTNPAVISGLAAGTYTVKVNMQLSSGGFCYREENVTVTSGGGGCTDNDNDGVCANTDCNDNDANLTTVGADCDDGNPNTIGDVVQSNCTCSGTSSSGNGDCSGLTFSGGSGQITVGGFTAGAAGLIEYIGANTGWSNVLHCTGNCTNPAIISGLAAGTYTVKVNMQLSSGGFCYREENVTVTSSGGGCTDNDNDGVCANTDCNDNDANLTTVGADCDDGNPNTIGDVVQSNCTCSGTSSSGNGDCSGLTFSGGSGQITVGGFTAGAAGIIEYIGANTGWSNVLHCTGNCTNPAIISGLAAGTYTVKVNMQLSSGGFCYRQEDVTVSSSSRIAPSNVFDLSVNIIKETVQLEWTAAQTDETESFIIEKSIDGIHFEPIKVITSNLEDYYFKNQDKNPDFGNNYYRIKQQFTSGEFQYSPIRQEAFHLDENTIALYPNPAKK